MSDFILCAESLASKWGFGDGDALDDYLYDIKDDGLITDMPERDSFLFQVVQRFLVPELTKRGIVAEIVSIGSNHNPVRADTVNGEEVDCYNYENCPSCLKGVEVRVSQSDIIEMVRQAIKARMTEGGEP